MQTSVVQIGLMLMAVSLCGIQHKLIGANLCNRPALLIGVSYAFSLEWSPSREGSLRSGAGASWPQDPRTRFLGSETHVKG